MTEQLKQKNTIAAILYLILGLSNFVTLLRNFSVTQLVIIIADVLLIYSLYKNIKGKMIITALFLFAAVNAARLISLTYGLISSTGNGAAWISYVMIFAGHFLFFIYAVATITDKLPSYKEQVAKKKYLPLTTIMLGDFMSIFMGRYRIIPISRVSIFLIVLVELVAIWLILCWMISPDDHRVEEGISKLSESIQHNMTETIGNARQAMKEQSENRAKKVSEEKKEDCIEELRKYKKLLDEDLITQEEYDSKKKELLDL